jgi:hypothetical protein
MEWYDMIQFSAVGYVTLHYDMVSKIVLAEFHAKLSRFGLADVNFYALSVIQSALPPLKVGGEGLNLGVA